MRLRRLSIYTKFFKLVVVVVAMKKTKEIATEIQTWHLMKKDMAASCGVSPQAFTSWGVPPYTKIKNSVYFDVKSVLENRVANALAKTTQNTTTTTSYDISEIADPVEKLRARKTEQEIKALELKNAVLEGRSLPASAVTEVLSRILGAAVNIFETLPLDIARKFPDLEPRVLRHLEKSIASVRNEAATLPEQLDTILDDIITEAEDRIN